MNSFRKVLINGALFLAMLVCLALATEGTLRAFDFKPLEYVMPEDQRGVSTLYRPHATGTWSGMLGHVKEFQTPISTNAWSYYDRDYTVEKEPGVFRVLCLGDSYVESWQVPLEKTFHKLLEKKLNERALSEGIPKKIEVIAFGSSGQGSLMELERLHSLGLSLSPDLVLAFLTPANDFNDDWHHVQRLKQPKPAQPAVQKPDDRLLKELELYRKLIVFPQSRLNRWIAFAMLELYRRAVPGRLAESWKNSVGQYAKPGSEIFKESESRWNEAFAITIANYARMNRLCSERGILFAAVIVDEPLSYDARLMRSVKRTLPDIDKHLDFDQFFNKLLSFLKKGRVLTVNLNSAFAKYHRQTGDSLHLRYDGHWNENGHDAVAAILEISVYDALARAR